MTTAAIKRANAQLVDGAKRGHIGDVKAALAEGASVNARDAVQNTALHWAAVANSFDVARLLIDSGADLEAVNASGRRPIELFLHAMSDTERNRIGMYVLLNPAVRGMDGHAERVAKERGAGGARERQ